MIFRFFFTTTAAGWYQVLLLAVVAWVKSFAELVVVFLFFVLVSNVQGTTSELYTRTCG